jgi:hypothetical protein
MNQHIIFEKAVQNLILQMLKLGIFPYDEIIFLEKLIEGLRAIDMHVLPDRLAKKLKIMRQRIDADEDYTELFADEPA